MAKLEIGSIITGKPDNGYSVTSNKALMVVTGNNNSGVINVAVIGRANNSYLGDEFDGLYEENFVLTSFDEFYYNYPDTYMVSDSFIEELKRNYGISEFIESTVKVSKPEPYVLSDKQREELLAEMENLLSRFNYHPTRAALNKILDEWAKNKGDLIRLFEKHPNYNGKFQIAFDYDFSRDIDFNAIYNFRRYLKSDEVQSLFRKEVQIGAFSYRELRDIGDKLSGIIEVFSYGLGIHHIDGNNREYYIRERERFSNMRCKYYRDNPNVHIANSRAYDREAYDKLYILKNVVDILDYRNHMKQMVDAEVANYFMDRIPEAKIKEGQKLSRAINKILKMIGVDKRSEYNKEFAKFADAVNPLKIRRHTVLSIHPIDYYTMSFGNSWSSCHTIDKNNIRRMDNGYHGAYSSGTESYMLDGSSMIFYTVDGSYDGNELELQDKINRNMFHYNDNQLIQARVYPQSCDDRAEELYTDIRQIVQKIMADCLNVPNLWTYKAGINACRKVTDSYGTHYRDYTNFDNRNVSTLKDGREKEDHRLIKIGHDPICPCCGTAHDWEKCIECYNCYNEDSEDAF